MKHVVLVFVVTVLTKVMPALAQNDSFDFPIRPGTKEWNQLKTYEEKLNAYNIPSDILDSMSTKGLVESCLKYPEFRLIMTRNDLQSGYAHIRSIFNGFRELEKRADAVKSY